MSAATEPGMEGTDGSAAEIRTSPALNYELIRENRALLQSLANAEQTVLSLRLDALQREIDHLKLSLGLQQASAEMSKLQTALAAVRPPRTQSAIEREPEPPALASGAAAAAAAG